MKMKLQRSDLIKGLQAVRSAVGVKCPQPILSNVKFEVTKDCVLLTTSNLDTTIRTEVACEASGSFDTTMPYAYLYGAVAKMPDGEIAFEYTASSESMVVTGGSFNIKLKGQPAEKYPKLPYEDKPKGVSVPCETLARLIRSVMFAASRDETRQALRSALLRFKDGSLTVVATDGRRLALNRETIEAFDDAYAGDIILPSSLHGELVRMLSDAEGDASVSRLVSQACITVGKTEVFTKLIEDAYPDYTKVIPAEDGLVPVEIDRAMLIEMLDRVSIFASDEAHSVNLTFSTGKLQVKSPNTEIGEANDEQPVKYEGETRSVTFNPQYLIEPAKVIPDDAITMMLNGGKGPVIVKGSGSFLGVVMPLRLN